MRTGQELKQEIEECLGFFPPFFEPALNNPLVLDSLWQQTLTAYVRNPLPEAFKEKLAALLARFCKVPYCLICHSASLRPLGLSAQQVLDLLQTPLPRLDALRARKVEKTALRSWPESDSDLEKWILDCSVTVFQTADPQCLENLRALLSERDYGYLTIFLLYNRTCLSWAEANPALSYQSDHRVRQHLAPLLEAEPALVQFFDSYLEQVQAQELRRLAHLQEENRRLAEESLGKKRLEARYHELERQFEALVEQAPVALALLSGPELRFAFFNSCYAELAGQRELLGLTVREAFPELAGLGFYELLDRVYATGQPHIEKEAHISLNRSDRLEETIQDFSYSALMGEAGEISGVVIVAHDVTVTVNARKELAEARAQAEQASYAKSEFLANMSHEIRTPLAAILGYAEILKQGDLEDQDRLEFAETICRNGVALTRLVDDILDLSKVEAGQMEPELIDFAPRQLLGEVRLLFEEQARAKGLQFDTLCDEKVPARIATDPTRLRQILVNLIGNALKFTSQGAVTVSIQCPAEIPKALDFHVRDTGVGLTADQSARLFKPFSQGDNSTTRRFGGTGLGLALSRRLANILGGDVWLESGGEGQGSHFVARVTFAAPSDKQHRSASDPLLPEQLKGKRMLLVEDVPDNQRMIKHILQRLGIVVHLAEDGVQGVEMALAGEYDVILMDMQMPRLDGFTATRMLRQQGYVRPVVALTAHAMLEERNRIAQCGCDAHLTKPLQLEEMIHVLNQFCQPERSP